MKGGGGGNLAAFPCMEENQVPTIRVKSPSGWVTINASDFDPAVHKEWTDGKEEAVSEAAQAEVMQPRRGRPPKSRD